MKIFKKIVVLTTLATVLCQHSGSLNAQQFVGGNGYQQARTVVPFAAAIGLTAVALAAIIAVAVQNSHSNHGHSE